MNELYEREENLIATVKNLKDKINSYEEELNKLKYKLDQCFEYNQRYTYETEAFFNPMAYHHRILADIFCDVSEIIDSILNKNVNK